jgi:septal ring factor EnvC (AmiA/AmiB activator)
MSAQGADDRARRLEELRTEIEARESKARELRSEADGVLGELEGVDRELHELRRSLRALRERRTEAEEELKGTRRRQIEVERSRRKVQNQLESRLVALYKFHSTGGIPALYSAGTFQEVLLRRDALTRVVGQDERLFGQYRAAEVAYRKSAEKAAALVIEIDQTRREVAPREEEARKRHVERRNLVALLRTRADRERRVADELREAAERLERMLKDRRGRSRGAAGTGLQRGKLVFPSKGSVRLGFGRQLDPEFGTETLRNGIEIAAVSGAPVRAVAGGEVLFAGWFKGYGQIVILDHGAGDVSVSGYLADVAVEPGSTVKRGAVIGEVGETGPLSGPGLYFEIRHDGKPVNPKGWFEPQR